MPRKPMPARSPALPSWSGAAAAVVWAAALSLLPSGDTMGQSIPAAKSSSASDGAACPTILQHRFARLQDAAPQDLCQFAGKVVLVVNTASYCGFTPQYEGLERLYGKYRDRGLVILGFPSNDFGQQEPGNASQIADVCFNTYAVRFPMFAKTVVAGAQRDNTLYAALHEASGEPPRWNFHKYLIDRSGKVVASFASRVAPEDKAVVAVVEDALARRR